MAGYGADDAFMTWLASNGYVLPEGAPSAAVLRQRGSAYLDGVYGSRFSGSPTAGFAQERAWPRTGAEAHCMAIPFDVVPIPIEQASYAAAWFEATNPGALSASGSQAAVIKREKIAVIETEYAVGTGDALRDATVRLASVEGLIASFLKTPVLAILVV